jgi:hypothetical protein
LEGLSIGVGWLRRRSRIASIESPPASIPFPLAGLPVRLIIAEFLIRPLGSALKNGRKGESYNCRAKNVSALLPPKARLVTAEPVDELIIQVREPQEAHRDVARGDFRGRMSGSRN